MSSTQRSFCTLAIAILLIALSPSILFAESGDDSFKAASIQETLYDFYAASTFGDIDAMASLISSRPDTVFIGTDPSEVFSGHDEIVQWWQGIFDFLESLGYPNNGGLPLTPTGDPVQISHRGSIAWVVDEPDFEFLNGNVPTRLTLVLRREHGRWKIVQGHFSFGVPDADLPV